MLRVTLNLSAVAAMLIAIVVPSLHVELDGSNRTTAKPIPGGGNYIRVVGAEFKRMPASIPAHRFISRSMI